MKKRRCCAKGCIVGVLPRMLMCSKHWSMVPRRLQRLVWEHYQYGQERGKVAPSPAWQEATDAAIEAVAEKEAALS